VKMRNKNVGMSSKICWLKIVTEFPIQFNAPDIAETEITKNGCRCRRIRMSAVIKRDP